MSRKKGPGEMFYRGGNEILCLLRVVDGYSPRLSYVFAEDSLIDMPQESWHNYEFWHKRTFMFYGHQKFRPFLAKANIW